MCYFPDVGVVTEPEVEGDVVGSVAPSMESEDADDNEVVETGEDIREMAKMELVSPEYPNPVPHTIKSLGT
jgi:hypothetical protein